LNSLVADEVSSYRHAAQEPADTTFVEAFPNFSTSQSGSPIGDTSMAVSVNPNSFACWMNCRSGTPNVTGMMTAVAPAERARAMKGAQSVVSSGANVSPAY
jgi:hypothetical protein